MIASATAQSLLLHGHNPQRLCHYSIGKESFLTCIRMGATQRRLEYLTAQQQVLVQPQYKVL